MGRDALLSIDDADGFLVSADSLYDSKRDALWVGWGGKRVDAGFSDVGGHLWVLGRWIGVERGVTRNFLMWVI